MTTREVADYLRIKERKVYDLLREKRIPATRVTGKWLFPKPLIDQWVAEGTEFPDGVPGAGGAMTLGGQPPPAVCAGSHDPLLEWSLRESGCELAMMPGGSLDGLERLAAGDAMLSGLHVYDADSDTYNQAAVQAACPGLDVVLVEWAWREQGLALAPGNPLGIASIADLESKKARVCVRQPQAGARILFAHLIGQAGLEMEALDVLEHPAMSETDLSLAVQEGKANAGLCVASVAAQHRLDFLPLHRERFDLAIHRRAYFEPPVQDLLAFAASPAFLERAKDMPGYDVSALGRVVYNAP
ncbi:MAG: helix-turn-helix transcriptional regulator [Rhodospirillales bacterium]|nr:helix-turn-helix transcriptional regulator [Alphaproteobacteria bacterium]MBL6948277.1 helix-turn-helix transcriptional regulator [Rhodospirillales bacterium]